MAVAVLVLSFIGYPLVAPISLILDIPNIFVSIPFRALILIIALIVIIKRLLMRDKIHFRLFDVIWWIFWILYISRITIDGFFDPEALRLPIIQYYAYALGFAMIPALSLSVCPDHAALRRSLYLIIILGVIGIIFNMCVIHGHQILDITMNRIESKTLNAISFSHLGVTVFILSMWVLTCSDTRGFLKSLFFILALLIGASAALAGASRGPLLALVLTLTVVIYLGIKNWRASNSFRFSFVIVIFLSGLAFLLTSNDTILAFRRVQESMFSDDTRWNLYIDGMKLLLANPILGAGIEPLGFYPHNVILESFILSGFFSGIIFIAIISFSFLYVIRIIVYDPKSSWISLLYVQFVAGAMFSGALYDSASMWIIISLVNSHFSDLHHEGLAFTPQQASENCIVKSNALQ